VSAQATFFTAESTVLLAWRSSMPIVMCEKPQISVKRAEQQSIGR
jgi:hypothetical protein